VSREERYGRRLWTTMTVMVTAAADQEDVTTQRERCQLRAVDQVRELPPAASCTLD